MRKRVSKDVVTSAGGRTDRHGNEYQGEDYAKEISVFTDYGDAGNRTDRMQERRG